MRPAAGEQPPAPLHAAPVLHPDQSLDMALRMFGEHKVLPVVSRQNVTRVLGELLLDDVLAAYGIRQPPRDATGLAAQLARERPIAPPTDCSGCHR